MGANRLSPDSMTLEHCLQPAQFEQISYPRFRIRQLQDAPGFARGQIDADHRTEARAIDVVDVCQVQHNALGLRDESADCFLQQLRCRRGDPARPVDDNLLGFLFYVELQLWSGNNWIRRHGWASSISIAPVTRSSHSQGDGPGSL